LFGLEGSKAKRLEAIWGLLVFSSFSRSMPAAFLCLGLKAQRQKGLKPFVGF